MPQSQSGSTASRSGAAPQVTVPVARLGGQGGVVATETVASGLVQSTAPASGADVAVASRVPATSGSTASAAATNQSRSQSPAERGNSLMATATTTGIRADVAVASRVPTRSEAGRTTSDASPSRAVNPGERGSGLVAAAAPGISTPGAASNGAGPGASETGEGRAQLPSGGSSAARDAPATLLAASNGGISAAPSGPDAVAGQLSAARTEASVQATRETRAAPLQKETPNGQARVIEERLTVSALQKDAPKLMGETPLMLAGFDRTPIPKGLDSINATAARLPGEILPSHHPGNEAPRYPKQALDSRAEGRVLVHAEIRADGQIGKFWIKQGSGSQALDFAALDTVRVWRFTPAQRHGMAVPMGLDVPIEYKLLKE